MNSYQYRYTIRKLYRERQWRWFWTRRAEAEAAASATADNRQYGAVAAHPLSISTDGFEPDVYVLEIEVSDRLSGEKAVGRARFEILEETKRD